MNAELYQQYIDHMNKSVPRIAQCFQLAPYLLEETILDRFVKVADCFDPQKANIKTYANRMFWNAAIDLSKQNFIYAGDETECTSSFDQERQTLLADMISNLSEASNYIVNAVLTGKAPIKKVTRHGGKEKCMIKKWLLKKKGWAARKIDECFLEIQQALKEIESC